MKKLNFQLNRKIRQLACIDFLMFVINIIRQYQYRRMKKLQHLQQNTMDLFRPSSKLKYSRQKQTENVEKYSASNKNSHKKATQFGSSMNKNKSQPRFRTLKEEILRIPKVKQILNKDKYVFAQDIQKRIQLLGSLKAEKFEPQQIANLHQMRKPKPEKNEKKNRRHKTNFKVPLTRKNISSMNNLLKGHIDQNQKYKNQQVVFLKEYESNAPFSLEKLKFMDDLNPIKQKYKEKFPNYKEGVLSRNKLLLQHVILNRNIKRQMKLDKKKQQKNHAKRVFQNI